MALHDKVAYKDFSLMQYEWGTKNNKTAYLVHEWEGQTTKSDKTMKMV